MNKRNKFDIILPDGTKYYPPAKTMIVMNTDGVVFLATDNEWYGWHVRLLSLTVPRYDVVMKT